MKSVLLSVGLVVACFGCFGVSHVQAQDQQITVTRELRIGFDTASKTFAYNWTVKIKCGGRPPREFDLTIEQYFDLYSDAVDAAIGAGKARETFSARTRKRDSVLTETMIVTTTYTGRCVTP